MAKAKRQGNNQQRTAHQVTQIAQEKHKSEVRKRKRPNREADKEQKRAETPSEDAAAKSKRKIEKLRKQLEREEMRIAKTEAHASNDQMKHKTEIDNINVSALDNQDKERKRSGSSESGCVETEETNRMKPKPQETGSMVPDPLTPTSQPALAEEEQCPLLKALNADDHVNSSTGHDDDEASSQLERSIHESSVSTSESSSDSTSTDSEDSTSSSGSSSEGISDDGAPDETSIKRSRPERVAPPKRGKSKQICRAFLHKGSCKRGSYCKYLHELPERGRREVISQEVKGAERRKERVGLYQRVSHHA